MRQDRRVAAWKSGNRTYDYPHAWVLLIQGPLGRIGVMGSTGIHAIGYCRVSSLSQVQDGSGLGVQKDRIMAWGQYQNIQVIKVEEDAGISGSSTDNRPGFRAAMRSVLELGCKGVLVTYSLSRLGRDALDLQEAISVLLHAGVRVVSISDGVDSASGMGATVLRIVVSVLSMIAELERETIRTRLLDGRRRADATNKVYSSEPRYGRRVVDSVPGDLEDDPLELRAVETIKSLHAKGHSYRTIAELLDEMGLKPRRAMKWNHVVVGRIATGRRQPKRSHLARRIERATAEWLEADPALASPT